MLSTAKDFLNCSHRNEKYLIVGLSLDQGRCIANGLESRSTALILNNYISDLKVSF